jgi:ATP-binding cassette subfamily F protein uup
MALCSVQSLTIGFGGPPLLDGVSFTLDAGERVCLVGRNGEGKSTLIRILAGEETPDNGTMAFSSGVRVAQLTQVFPSGLPGTVRDVVESGIHGDVHDPDAQLHIEKALSQLDLDPDAVFELLSGGQKRRTLLAKALVSEPDILLLDEPTNHMDVEGIQHLERLLPRFPGAVLFVTHDRHFLRSVATRILELDRGSLRDWDCGYDKFLQRREDVLAAEEKQQALFDKRLAEEERWIRQGIKARRTRNEGRVRALKKMRNERSQRRERTGTATLQMQEAERSGRKVIEAKGLCMDFGGEPLIADFSTRIMRGDKIGFIGPNGSGKTTLLNILLDKLKPVAGEVEHGTQLDITFFDQHREILDEEKSLMDNVGDGSDFILFEGQRRHVISYLEDFLFPPSRSRTPVKVLSGGERNRLLLAKMFTKPGNVLVMDEPTNDLDIETLELLESLLVNYTGTLLLVSHDREFLDNVVTSTIAYEGKGKWKEYPGGYADWLIQRKVPEVKKETSSAPTAVSSKNKTNLKPLNGKEKREWQELPAKIESLEAELEALGQQMSLPEFYQLPEPERNGVLKRSEAIPGEMDKLFGRWEELEERAEAWG